MGKLSIDWRPKSEPYPDDMIRDDEAFLILDEPEEWVAFASENPDNGGFFLITPDGCEHHATDLEEIGYTHWARLTLRPFNGESGE